MPFLYVYISYITHLTCIYCTLYQPLHLAYAILYLSHPDHSLLCMFLCFVWSGCDLSGHSMLDVLFVCFYVWPDMVLNQRQVLVIVSDWEPYLGSLFCVWFCGWMFLSLCLLHQIGLFSVLHISCFVYCSFIIFIKDVSQ